MSNQRDYNYEVWMEQGKGAFQSFLSLTRHGALINGGAAIACLGFLSSLIGDSNELVPAVSKSIVFFAWGVAVAVSAIFFSFLSDTSGAARLGFTKPFWIYTAWGFQWLFFALAVFSALFPIAAFLLGVISMSSAIIHFTGN